MYIIVVVLKLFQSLVRSLLGVLKALAGSDVVKVEVSVRVMASGGPDIIVKILHLHAKISSVQASKIDARCRNSSNVVSL